MCYNYEAMIRSNIKRSVHEHGYDLTMESLSEEEKEIWKRKIPNAEEGSSASSGKEDDEVEKQTTYPGAQVLVIPITTRKREYYHFGFLPSWAKSFNDHRKNFNARAETIREKPTWKKAWNNKQRCLVCASGFYEDDKPNKKRYFFSVKGKEEIFFAGIFNHWADPETGEIHKTFAIITTEPNMLVGSIHPRMPVILDTESEITWLKVNATEEAVYELLKPYPSDLMEMTEAPKPPRKKKDGSGKLNLGF